MGTKALSALWSVKLCCSIRTSSSHHFSCVNNHTHMRFGRCTKHIHLQCIHMQSHIIQRGAQHCPHPSFDHTLIYRPSLQWLKKKKTLATEKEAPSHRSGVPHLPTCLPYCTCSPSPPVCSSPWARLDASTLIGLAMTVMHYWVSAAQTHTNKLCGWELKLSLSFARLKEIMSGRIK